MQYSAEDYKKLRVRLQYTNQSVCQNAEDAAVLTSSLKLAASIAEIPVSDREKAKQEIDNVDNDYEMGIVLLANHLVLFKLLTASLGDQ